MSSSILDASALLTILLAERGAQRTLEAARRGAAMGTVNLTEVAARMRETGASDDEIREQIAKFGLEIIPFDEELAYQTGFLRPLTRHLGLSLGARACLALGMRLGLPVLTADAAWAGLQLGIPIEVVR
ncbi:MAG TPA: type II toxin-antitoxin system VapC family toxin [Dehalococcoidia bacterium]|nr:type II toxin-antitoxin system VapC family toxin [Dehalococcoidia bacterium]